MLHRSKERPMSKFAQWFNLFSKGGRRRARKPERRQPIRPAIERLEDRMVPTVAFRPVFGAEHMLSTGGHQLQSPRVFPIFWGSWWKDHEVDAAQIATSFNWLVKYQGNLNGSEAYLSGTTQYGSANGYADPWYSYTDADRSNEPPQQIGTGGIFVNAGPVSGEIEHVLYDLNALPNPDSGSYEPIYVVVTPPNVTGTKNSGFNMPGIHKVYDLDKREEVWVSTSQSGSGRQTASGLNLDAITSPFSYVPGFDGATVSKGCGYSGSGDNQIADFEPDGEYVYRLGGPGGQVVQAYWSDRDQQFIVPDGNSLTMQIQPNPWVNGNFAGGKLVVNANQAGAPANQVIMLDTVQMPTGLGVQVVMDGQTFAFEPGQITSIEVDAANDSETISVDSTLAGVPVTINLGAGHDTVNINPSHYAPIQSTVTVNNSRGGSEVVTIDSPLTNMFRGVVNVNNTNGRLDVQLAPDTKSLAHLGPVNVAGGGATSLTVHDENDNQGTTYTVTTEGTPAVTRLGAWVPGTFSLRYSGITTLTLDGGTGPDTYDLTNWAPLDEQQFNINPGRPPWTGSAGPNTLMGPAGVTTWVINGWNSGYLTNGGPWDKVTFGGIQNLQGSGINTWQIWNGGVMQGNVTGSTRGSDTLDYSHYTANGVFLVDLQFQGVPNMIPGIQGMLWNVSNVIGSNGPHDQDILIGNGGSYLRGGAGDNLIISGDKGGGLIGGGGDNILIAARTTFDTDPIALGKLMKNLEHYGIPYMFTHLTDFIPANAVVVNYHTPAALVGGGRHNWFFGTNFDTFWNAQGTSISPYKNDLYNYFTLLTAPDPWWDTWAHNAADVQAGPSVRQKWHVLE
jgi:hypothetical protein